MILDLLYVGLNLRWNWARRICWSSSSLKKCFLEGWCWIRLKAVILKYIIYIITVIVLSAKAVRADHRKSKTYIEWNIKKSCSVPQIPTQPTLVQCEASLCIIDSNVCQWRASTQLKERNIRWPNQWFSHWNSWVSAVSWMFLFLTSLLNKLETKQQCHRCDPFSLYPTASVPMTMKH